MPPEQAGSLSTDSRPVSVDQGRPYPGWIMDEVGNYICPACGCGVYLIGDHKCASPPPTPA